MSGRAMRGGFTLAEALVALAVFALLFTALWDFASGGFRLFRRGAARLDALHGGSFALERIKAELREATDSLAVRSTRPDAPLPRQDALRFARPRADGRPGAEEVEIVFLHDSGTIVRRASGGARETIGRDILGLHFELLRYPLPGERPPLHAVLVEVRCRVEGVAVPFRSLVVPRMPGRAALDPAWVDNETGDTIRFGSER